MARGSEGGSDCASSESVLSGGGEGEGALEMMLGSEVAAANVPGGGTPLTI